MKKKFRFKNGWYKERRLYHRKNHEFEVSSIRPVKNWPHRFRHKTVTKVKRKYNLDDGLFFKDGTKYDAPKNPFEELYPDKMYNCISWGYGCMFCGKCPLGDYFKYSDEELEIKKKYDKEFEEYNKEMRSLHGIIFYT